MGRIGNWRKEEVGGHLCDIFQPRKLNAHGSVIIYLHGVHLEKLDDKPAFVNQFERYGLPLISPIAQRSWWSNQICAEFDQSITAERHLLENVLPFVEQQFGSQPSSVGLLGTSMGGQGALRMAYKYPDLFPIVAAISPAIDYQTRFADGDEVLRKMYPSEEAVRQDTATLHVHPLNWPRHQFFCCDPADVRWIDSAERLQMKLASLGIPFERDLESSRGGHGFAYYNFMAERAIKFIVDSLERERRRIV